MGTETTNNIRALRHNVGINQKDLADVLGCDIQTINRYENGRRDPSLAMSLRIAAYFNKTVEEIFTLQNQK